MLALVAMLLVTLIASATAVWVYRKVSGWHGFTATLVGSPQSTTRMKIGAQQGFISMVPKRRKKSKNVILRRPNRKIKTPWGW
jgi:hypothetical protein